MDWTKDRIGGGDKTPMLSDLAETLNLKDGKPHTVRAIGPARRVARHCFEVMKKDGGGKARFPKLCLAYNSDSGEFDGKCPYCDIDPNTPRIEVHQNFIDRKLQEDAPRKIKPPRGSEKELVRHMGEKMFLKESKSSESWTPVRLAALSTSPARKIADYTEVNKRKTEDGPQVFGPNHPRYGFDVIIKFDGSRSPAEQYSVMKDENTKLTDEERKYLRWPLDLEKPDSLKDAKKEAERIAAKLVGKEDDEDEDDDDKPKKSKGKKKSRQVDIEDEDFDDDEDEPKSKKNKAKSKRRDDDDEDDDDEEDEPRSKKSKSTSKKRRDDDDEDDEDEDDEPKSKKKPAKKKADDWDDDDEDEDDEDDKPRGKKKPSKKSRDDDDDEEDEDDEPKSKKKKRKVEEDDDDDEDEDDRPKKKSSKTTSKKRSRDDDDDDDEDEPKSKKSKSSSKKKTRRSEDVDDEDDSWDDDGDDDDDDD